MYFVPYRDNYVRLPNLSILSSVDTIGKMGPIRTITSTDAKASLGELLGTLAIKGPVSITRNGRVVAVLSEPVRLDPPGPLEPLKPLGETHRLAELAVAYAGGKVSWREIASVTGAAFGDLLAELSRQRLQLPRVNPAKTPERTALLMAALSSGTASDPIGAHLRIEGRQ